MSSNSCSEYSNEESSVGPKALGNGNDAEYGSHGFRFLGMPNLGRVVTDAMKQLEERITRAADVQQVSVN